jgi:hypothetical protein
MSGGKDPVQKCGAQYGIRNQEPAETNGGHLQAASPGKIPGPAPSARLGVAKRGEEGGVGKCSRHALRQNFLRRTPDLDAMPDLPVRIR